MTIELKLWQSASVIILIIYLSFVVAILGMRANAVNHHAAHYDAKTGAFTWNDKVNPEVVK